MARSSVSAFCGDSDLYTTLSKYDDPDQILAINIPEYKAPEESNSKYCLPDDCLAAEGHNFTHDKGGWTGSGCIKLRTKYWCPKANKLEWTGTNLLYTCCQGLTSTCSPKPAKGSCKSRPQFCSAPECISDNVMWEEPKLPGAIHRGCSHVQGDKYFHQEVGKARCPLKEKVQVSDGRIIVDTTDAGNMKECTEWTETQPCTRKLLQQVAESELGDQFHRFSISSDGCTDGVQLAVVDNDLAMTEEYISYHNIPGYAAETGPSQPENTCFRIHFNLCGPDSLSFASVDNKDLFLTVCDSLVLMNPEEQNCGSKFNQCWRSDWKATDEESFKFLVYPTGNRLLAENEKELADVVEDTVKSTGFLADEDFSTPLFISAKCIGNDQWQFVDDFLK